MLQKQLKKIAEKTTKQANKKRSEGPDLREGDPVYIIRKNIKTQRPSDKLDHTKIGPYRIKRKLGPVTFKLELPKGLNIYPVFHKSLLEKAPPNAKPGPVLVHEETQQPIYDVERVVDSKTRKRQRYYLVKWLGYGEEENTWEPEEHLTQELVRKYHRQSPAGKTNQHPRAPATR